MWHDYGKETPKERGLYLTLDEKGIYEITMWNGKSFDYMDKLTNRLEWWMPLPKPPGGNGRGV
jgi:hypothetical protein